MTDDLNPELLKKAEEVVNAHRRVRADSALARVNFHEKLAVITAGSLAIAVTVAGGLYQKPLQSTVATHWLFNTLAVSAILLWFSLVASVLHNFLESSALHFDTRLQFDEGTLTLFKAMFETGEIQRLGGAAEPAEIAKVVDLVADKLLESQHRTVRQAESLRAWGMPLSIAATSLLGLGYLCVVIYIVVLARSVQ